MSFDGARVVAFESRMAETTAELIRRHGGEPVVAPALREVPIGENPAALEFAERLMAGGFDVVVFLTGVGARYLAEAIETRYPRADWLEALSKVEVVVRGPKPRAVLREWGARVDVQVPEPNTWLEVLEALDAHRDLAGLRIAVQEYGASNTALIEGLGERGAEVTPVPVYRWALPEDTGPLRAATRQIAEGTASIALFTTSQQVVHLLRIAKDEGCLDAVLQALRTRVVVASIGPTTTEALQREGIAVDIEPTHAKLGHLIASAAAGWRDLPKSRPGRPAAQPAAPPPRPQEPDALHQSHFLRACRREATPVTPIWLMRQAGRYMPEYRELRSKVSFLDLCRRPELAAEVTITAAKALGVDAAILFADILLILQPLGFELEFSRGEGPVIHNPVREARDVERVAPLDDVEALGYVFEAVRQIRAGLPAGLPLIGFAGAPFTLACYAIEGGASRHYDRAKAFMYRDPGAWDALMTVLVDATAAYLQAQVQAGCQALQIFDSWVGTVSPADYRRFVQPHMARLFGLLPRDVPTIHFGTGTGGLLELQRDAGGDVIGLDWRVELGPTWDRLGPGVAVQGNLDPAVLLAPIPEIRSQARRILAEAAGRPGHIFNLGHGILPTTPVDHVKALVDLVHEA